MKKSLLLSLLAFTLLVNSPANATTHSAHASKHVKYTHGVNGKVTPKTIGAGALSLLVWPGIGQLMNDDTVEKSAVHAVLGFTGIFRFWSCYDAVVDRKGGVWENRI